MSAATQDIDTPQRTGDLISLPVAASTTIYAGTLVAVNASGYAVPASDAAGLAVIGRAEEAADNSAGSAGDLSVTVKRGVFRFANSGTNALAQADIGKVAYVEDDNTVGSSGGTNNIVAGLVVDVDDDGVWVDTAARAKFAAEAVTLTVGAALGAFTDPPSAAEMAALRTFVNALKTDAAAVKAALDAQGITS